MEPKNKLFDFSRAGSTPTNMHQTENRHVASVSGTAAQHGNAPHTEFTDTITFRSPVIKVDRQQLENQRILAPGAGGPIGSPYKMLRTQVLRRMEQLGANMLALMSPTEGAEKP